MNRAHAAINSIAYRANVALQAGEAYKQVAGDVIAPAGDITVLAKQVDITEARETTLCSKSVDQELMERLGQASAKFNS